MNRVDYVRVIFQQRLPRAGFGESLTTLRQRVHESMSARDLFNGIHRFIFEDALESNQSLSRSRVREQSKDVAYEVIQRSNAWGRLVAGRFPEAVRLSIHPQPRISEKIGISLVPCANNWGTPWHNVVLAQRNGYRLVKRAEAEEQNAVLVYRDGRPSHFVQRNAVAVGVAL